ncbi:hypothetical protein ACPPVO_45675 [Dactylosporangium sp. McL0621]|uniref:hypothetical protein n=1 Tax=Dactylosporangium sp. McL0621 TaxID=3415678 RepID=UPI003CF82C41
MNRAEQARAVWHRAAADEPAARWFLAGKLQAAGRVGEALEVWRMAAEAGDPGAWHELAMLTRVSAGPRAALRVREEAAAAGAPMASSGLADVLVRIGRVDEAVALARRSVEEGDPGAARMLGHAIELSRRGVPGTLHVVDSDDTTELLTPYDFMAVTDEQWDFITGDMLGA